MVDATASDYANYLRQIDFAKEVYSKLAYFLLLSIWNYTYFCFQIAPICTNIDEILTRMDELESSISIASIQTEIKPIIDPLWSSFDKMHFPFQ